MFLLNLNGLGIVGGISNFAVDGSEFVDFAFARPVIDVTYSVSAQGNLDGDGSVGERVLEAFGADGSSLGTVNQSSSDSAVTALFGGQPISRFRLQADVDNHRIGSVTYTLTGVGTISDTATVTVIVNGQNDSPIANADTNQVHELDGSVDSTSNNIGGNVLHRIDHLGGFADVADTDVDTGTVLTVADVGGTAISGATDVAGTRGTLTMNPDGSYTYDLNDADPFLDTLDDGQITTDTFTVTVVDGHGGSDTTTLTITIHGTTENAAPTDIALDSTDVDENATVGTAVGTFSTTDVDEGDSYTYSLVTGTGATDNARFSIGGVGGDELLTAEVFDFETQGPVSIRVRTTDNGLLSFEEVFTIDVNNVNEAPTVANSIADVTANQDDPDLVIDVSNVFDDVDAGDMLTFTVMGNTNATLVSASIVGTTLTLNYLPDQNGTADITVRSTDLGGLFVEDMLTVTVLSPQDQIDNLNDAVQDLLDAGSLNGGQGNALTSKLQNAINKLNQGNINSGVNKLESFINQVNAFINSGVLTAAEGEPLIDAANAAIASALPGLRADEAFVGNESMAAAITADDVQSVFGAAIESWQDHGMDTHRLDSINVYVANLPNTYLGVASAESIWIDVDAAGYGWSLNGSGGMDLLWAVTHEFGHVLGFDHDHHHPVMRDTLTPLTPTLASGSLATAQTVDDLFSLSPGAEFNLLGNRHTRLDDLIEANGDFVLEQNLQFDRQQNVASTSSRVWEYARSDSDVGSDQSEHGEWALEEDFLVEVALAQLRLDA